MKLKKMKLFATGTAFAMLFGGAASAAECIAPANAGGGWDFTCRQIGKIMYDIGVVDEPIQVTNMSATSTRLAQNAFGGMTSDQVRFLGAIGADPGVIVVAADSPYETLADLVNAIIADPGSVTFAGGSAAGGFDHLKPLMILQRAGFTDVRSIKYIGVDGGADAITQTIGGFTQAMTGDMSEIVGFIRAGEVRALAVLTEERVPGFEDIPTAREQGYDVVAVNWRGLYVPGGISDEAYERWAERLRMAGNDGRKRPGALYQSGWRFPGLG